MLKRKKTIGKVLKKIQQLKINNFDLVLDIIIVDGGSTDGSINIIKKFKEFKFYKLKNVGKGEAIKFGIDKSKGDIISFFPSDNEYKVEDIEKVITPIILNQSKVVYGSRMIKVTTLNHELKKIYKMVGAENNVKMGNRPSAGFLGILFFLTKTNPKSITLIGFDFFSKKLPFKSGNDYPSSWHLPHNSQESSPHNNMEKPLVQKWANEGKLEWKILSDLNEEFLDFT